MLDGIRQHYVNLLTSGGHNAGVVSPPGMQGRSYQIASHGHDAGYIAPDTWQSMNELHEGSWWPAWEAWLGRRAGASVPPPKPVAALGDAPGAYVLQP
jgi:polyhydroxyalkanoate synthase